jgi:hypothetical protein
MQFQQPFVRIALALVFFAGVAGAQVPQEGQAPLARGAEPDFRLVVLGHFDADTLATFNRRAQEYATLRSRLEVGLPPLVVTTDADEIERFETSLSRRIRDARRPRRGQVFSPAMERQLKRLLRAKADAGTIASLLDDSPPEFDVDVNDTYSKKVSLATMPPNILLLLPDLPPDMEYRFVGRHLILRDVRANLIIDEIPRVLECDGCVFEIPDHDEHVEVGTGKSQ